MTEPVPNAQALAFLRASAERTLSGDLVADRATLRQLAIDNRGEVEQLASVEDVEVAGVPARLYRPAGGEDNVLVYFHGGAWMLGDIEGYDTVCRALANSAGCAVLSVEYRLAPEHPFPAGLDDCWAATEWAFANFRGVAIGGDSAGGNLAAVVALRAREHDRPLALQVLVYPVLDWGHVDGPAHRTYIERYRTFTGADNYTEGHLAAVENMWASYIPDEAQRSQPEASPFRAASLAGLAPAIVIGAEHDYLFPEGEEYAQLLRDAGVSVTELNYDGTIHGFFGLPGQFDESRDAVAKVGAALRDAFS
jgi:acetyl esterase